MRYRKIINNLPNERAFFTPPLFLSAPRRRPPLHPSHRKAFSGNGSTSRRSPSVGSHRSGSRRSLHGATSRCQNLFCRKTSSTVTSTRKTASANATRSEPERGRRSSSRRLSRSSRRRAGKCKKTSYPCSMTRTRSPRPATGRRPR